jgi:signal transduction histidine kinase
VTATGTARPQLGTAELATLFLFEKLAPDQLAWLARDGYVLEVPAGPVYAEGDPSAAFYVLLEGCVALSRRVGPSDVEVSRTAQRGAYGGAWQAYLGERAPATYLNSMRAVEPSRFFVVDADVFAAMVTAWFPMALHLLEGLFFGLQDSYKTIGQRERLLALGQLSAGLTHELNNPAAAAARAAAALRERVALMRHKLGTVAAAHWDSAMLDTLVRLQEEAVARVATAPRLGVLEAADREDSLVDWLDEHGVDRTWELAPPFAQTGLDAAWLDAVAAEVPTESVGSVMRWLASSVETELLLNEITDATTRIAQLVGAAKQYSQLDRAPEQTVDVHTLLDSTLVMLAGKLGPGITVVKDYDRSLPDLRVRAAELNQVWTNLIDNALGAMGGRGTLTVRTRAEDTWALVEIGDTGPGVPPEIADRIFEPFFTTKPIGAGTGLGLDISWRIVVTKHHGDLRVVSVPGDTRFQVRLPLPVPPPPPQGAAP